MDAMFWKLFRLLCRNCTRNAALESMKETLEGFNKPQKKQREAPEAFHFILRKEHAYKRGLSFLLLEKVI